MSDLPLVSMDFKKSDVSTTIDSSLTMVMGDDMVKVSHHSTLGGVLAVFVSWGTHTHPYALHSRYNHCCCTPEMAVVVYSSHFCCCITAFALNIILPVLTLIYALGLSHT